MDGSRSREALLQFLDYLSAKGLMEKATVQSRKAAASKILGILEPSEASDVTNLDMDDVIRRFGNLHGKNYTPGSLSTYRARLNSTIEDFKSYTSNPLAFRPAAHGRERAKAKPFKAEGGGIGAVKDAPSEVSRPPPTPAAAGNIMPIPIRADLTVYVQGLPFDLTEPEARKIAGVISAMALS